MVIKIKEKLQRLEKFEMKINLKNISYEEKKMQDIMIYIYLSYKKDNKIIILRDIRKMYKNSTGQLSNLLFLANPSEHSWWSSLSI